MLRQIAMDGCVEIGQSDRIGGLVFQPGQVEVEDIFLTDQPAFWLESYDLPTAHTGL